MNTLTVSDPDQARTVLVYLGGHFFSHDKLTRFVEGNLSGLYTADSVDMALLLQTGKLVEVLRLPDEKGDLQAAMTINYYPWKRLARQYFFVFYNEDDKEKTQVSLQQFSELLGQGRDDIIKYTHAVELAYFAVSTTVRKRGYGAKLFDAFLQRLGDSAENNIVGFTIVIGKYSRTSLGSMLMKHIFNNYQELARGRIFLQPLMAQLQLPVDLFATDPSAVPTAILAEKHGFRLMGYGQYLGQLWVKAYT